MYIVFAVGPSDFMSQSCITYVRNAYTVGNI